MKRWSPQRYQTEAKKRGISPTTIKNTLMHAKNIIAYCPGVYPIFTLRHLSYMAGVEYSFLRRIISREHEAPYREFYIRKKSSNSKRRICVPTSQLLKVQRFIHDNILKNLQVHSSSYAYSTESSIMDAATKHIESRWLIKLDVENFFESISEISVYRLFRDHGFPSLFSFELARICTRVGPRSTSELSQRLMKKYRNKYHIYERRSLKNIFAISEMGNLPQGAPTSPCLSNLACLSLDEALEELANKMGLRYSRYSDDITFSSQSINFKRGDACKVIAEACNFLAMHGFKPNRAKTDIIPPGAKKIVLGLNVDKSNVTLDKNFKNNIKQHIHFCLHEEIGPVKHARKRKFSSVIGFRNHLQGLIAYAKSIEPVFGDKMDKAFKCIKWPF